MKKIEKSKIVSTPALLAGLLLFGIFTNVQAAPKAEEFSGYYKLKTQFLEKEDKCLEGNKVDPSSTLKGAAFMDSCQAVSGQSWKLESAGDGYYRLKTQFLEKEDKCFEGNKVDPSSTLKGAAFMDSCQDVSGQLWKLEPTSEGYYRLKTQFLEKEDKCLEGNKLDPSSTLEGAAFMDSCQDVSGQLWKLEKV